MGYQKLGEHLALHVRCLINKLLDFVIKYQEGLPIRTSADYRERKEGEILGQLTPLFPIQYMYEVIQYDCNISASKGTRGADMQMTGTLPRIGTMSRSYAVNCFLRDRFGLLGS